MGFKKLLDFNNVTNFEANDSFNAKIIEVLGEFKIGYTKNIHLYIPKAEYPTPEGRICYIVSNEGYLLVSEVYPSTKEENRYSRFFISLEKELLSQNITYYQQSKTFKVDDSNIDLFLKIVTELFCDTQIYEAEKTVKYRGIDKLNDKLILTKDFVDEFYINKNFQNEDIELNNIKKEIDKRIEEKEKFDVFLSHRKLDKKEVIAIWNIFKTEGLSVYIDWIVDTKLDRSMVNVKTAALLRDRMKMSKTLVFLMSNNSSNSKWMPWELGYFDGLRGHIAIMPYRKVKSKKAKFQSQEYLELYDTCNRNLIMGNGNKFKVWMNSVEEKNSLVK